MQTYKLVQSAGELQINFFLITMVEVDLNRELFHVLMFIKKYVEEL
jgi:hypothetical protein